LAFLEALSGAGIIVLSDFSFMSPHNSYVEPVTSETSVGSGLSDVEVGLRLRYEIWREFAPYLGMSYELKVRLRAG
jgi:uncharacterized protein involved in copper resistance